MPQLSASDLARTLGVTRGRVSQYVSEGKLEGCYHGEGRQRRFDLDAAARALGRRLDPGQLMGNGARTRQALRSLTSDDQEVVPDPPRAVVHPAGASALTAGDADRYELARTQKAEEEARRMRRLNAEAEGHYVLASEVNQQVARLLAQEIAEFETVLRDGARRIADRLGVDFKAARQELVQAWRVHRGARAEALQGQAERAVLTEAEREADI